MIGTVEYQPKNDYGEGARSEGTLEVVHLKDLCELRRHEQPIQELANVAMERNAFYSPALLFPAIEAFGETSRLEFILVYATGGEEPTLSGFFPLESTCSWWRKMGRTSCAPVLSISSI